MAMAAARHRLVALGGAGANARRFYAAPAQMDAADVAHELEESSKWKKITIVMVTLALSYGGYVFANEKHAKKREKDMPYMNVRKKDFPWGPNPLIGYPWDRHPERYQDHDHEH